LRSIVSFKVSPLCFKVEECATNSTFSKMKREKEKGNEISSETKVMILSKKETVPKLTKMSHRKKKKKKRKELASPFFPPFLKRLVSQRFLFWRSGN